MTRTHRVLGPVLALGLIEVGWGADLPPMARLVAAGAAAFTAGGKASPDVDQRTKGWGIEVLRHRRTVHWPGWPTGIALAWWLAGLPLSAWAWAIVWGLWIGWVSHLPGDALFGAENPCYGLGKGIPLLPDGRWRLGTGWHCGTWIEHTVLSVLVGLLVWLVLAAFRPVLGR